MGRETTVKHAVHEPPREAGTPPRTLRTKKRIFMNRQEFDSQSRSTPVIRSDIDSKCIFGFVLYCGGPTGSK